MFLAGISCGARLKMLESGGFAPVTTDEESYHNEHINSAKEVSFDIEKNMKGIENRFRINEERTLDLTVRPKEDLYPFCIVWTPIPPITLFLPFVGHMGICDSKGVIYDFQGPYSIGEGNLAFGRTARYIQLVDNPTPEYAKVWDEAIKAANRVYCERMHNLCWDNCHSHVKNVLNRIEYGNFRYWNMGILAAWIFFKGEILPDLSSPGKILIKDDL